MQRRLTASLVEFTRIRHVASGDLTCVSIPSTTPTVLRVGHIAYIIVKHVGTVMRGQRSRTRRLLSNQLARIFPRRDPCRRIVAQATAASQ